MQGYRDHGQRCSTWPYRHYGGWDVDTLRVLHLRNAVVFGANSYAMLIYQL